MKAMLRKGEFWFCVVMIALVAGFVIGSFTYSPTARLFPLLVGIPTLLLLGVIAAGTKYKQLLAPFDETYVVSKKDKGKAAAIVEPAAQVPSGTREDNKSLGNVSRLIGWMVFFFALIFFFGFYIAVPVFVLGFLRFRARQNWRKSIIFAAVMGTLLYVSYETLMRVDLFQGIIFGDNLPPL